MKSWRRNAIPVHVHHLRRKLTEMGATSEIHTFAASVTFSPKAADDALAEIATGSTGIAGWPSFS